MRGDGEGWGLELEVGIGLDVKVDGTQCEKGSEWRWREGVW